MSESDSDESSDVLFNLKQITEEQGESLLSPGKMRKDSSEQTGDSGKMSKFPKSVLLILGTEFCERFNYYGMRTILVIYLSEWLGCSYNSSVALFHLFSMLAYFSPVFGAIIADGYLGRYRTILYISLVYAAGTLVLSLTAFPPPEIYGPMIGLLLISLGTGGIKPCVAAFGGDQFSSGQDKEQASFFSAFYFMINLGSMLSTFLTPMLRADVHCIKNSCYPLAFGVPTVLMFTALVIFVSGRNHYKRVPPTGNLFAQVVRCVWRGLKLRITHGKREGPGEHWMDYATDEFEKSFVCDVKSLLKVLWLFVPLPLFWALYDQQGSRWTLQAVDMNGDMGKLGRLKPDQVQVINPILILVFIPLFDRLIYPCLDKIRLPNRPLQRMCVGMLLCSVAFVIAGMVEIKLEEGKESPLNGQSGIVFLNSAGCKAKIESKFYTASIPQYEVSPVQRASAGDHHIAISCDTGNSSLQAISKNISTDRNQWYRIVILSENGSLLSAVMFPDKKERDKHGKATVSIAALFPSDPPATNVSISLREYTHGMVSPDATHTETVAVGNVSDFFNIEPGSYQLFVESQSIGSILRLGSGSVQTVVLVQEAAKAVHQVGQTPSMIKGIQFVTRQENQVSMGWQVPQYVVITWGEILFSITGLSFAYSQAPASMKSVLQAAWLMTTALGDLVVIIVAEASFMPSQSSEFLMFAGLMFVDTGLFALMAYFYTYSSAGGKEGDDGDTPISDTTTLVDAVADENGPDIRLDKLEHHGGAKED